MFTGIIQQTGRVESVNARGLWLNVGGTSFKAGDSVAVNGACLTVAWLKKNRGATTLLFQTSEETLSKTTLGRLKAGDEVNIEPPLRLSDQIGGHFVTGHVEAIGRVKKFLRRPQSIEAWFTGPKPLFKYIVPKGSVTVDGVSLTVVGVSGNNFSVSLIPFTLKNTRFGKLKVGDAVNLETDILAKYMENMIARRKKK